MRILRRMSIGRTGLFLPTPKTAPFPDASSPTHLRTESPFSVYSVVCFFISHKRAQGNTRATWCSYRIRINSIRAFPLSRMGHPSHRRKGEKKALCSFRIEGTGEPQETRHGHLRRFG
jgi:hypothetical protein